jgi:ADP-heptose:LPS heptosyltransferase
MIEISRITLRTPKTLGCSVATTALMQSLHNKFPNSRIVLYTRYPELFENLTEINSVINLNAQEGLSSYDIDLENYLDDRHPQTSLPRRHLMEHIFEIAEEKFEKGSLERNFLPKINLTNSEIVWARNEKSLLTQGKSLVWLQTKSRLVEKDIPQAVWREVVDKGSEKYVFIDLSQKQYTLRQVIALTAVADAGITLDSFLLHGSQAVHAKNVIVLLVSTYPEVVCYPNQIILNGMENPKNISVDIIIEKLDKLV